MITVNMTDIAKIVGVDYSTVWHWRRKGYVSPIAHVGRPLYDLEAIYDAIIEHRLKASGDTLLRIQSLLSQHVAF
jgi:DNA-binding transcriptional MerR regulator